VGDAVDPDLVFGLPEGAPAPVGDARTVVRLGLMEHAGRYGGTKQTRSTHRTYLETLASATEWWLSRGYAVRLLTGDCVDIPTKRAFRRLLADRLAPEAAAHVIDEPLSSVRDLARQVAGTDIVVATRFHNVVFAWLHGKPVISISFHSKCKALMAAFGLSEYCLEIDELRTDVLVETFSRLERRADELESRIRGQAVEFRHALDRRYEALFDSGGASQATWNLAAPGPSYS
jgi:polysaccharide pyruvyl transferase WcaK-like protein